MPYSSWENPSFLESLRQFCPPHRLCMFFEKTDDQLAAAAQYLRIGVEKKEPCLLLSDAAVAAETLAMLRAATPAADNAAASGACRVASNRADFCPEGRFDIECFFDMLRRWALNTTRRPPAEMRLVCDTAWILDPGVDETGILQFEVAMTRFVKEQRAGALCQWNRGAFAADSLRRVMPTYQALIHDGGIARNFQILWPEELLARPKGAPELDRVLANAVAHEKADRNIREEREALLTLFDALPEMAGLLSLGGSILQINEEGARRLGGTPEEIIGSCLFDYLPIDTEARRQRLDAVARTGQSQRYLDHRSGRKLDMRIVPVFDVLGNVTRLALLGIDITDRVKAEETLQQTVLRLQAMESVVNQSPAVVVRARLAKGWPVEYVSASMAQWGYSPDEVLAGKISWAKNSLPEEKQRFTADVEANLRAGHDVFRNEYRVRTATGEIRWTEAYERILRDESGTPTHLQAVVLDVTESKRVAEALAAHRDRLQSIFRAAPVGIAVVVNRMLHEVNDRLCSFSGYSRDELLGQSVRTIYPSDEEFARAGREIYEQLRSKDIAVLETQARKKDGGIIDILLGATLARPRDPSSELTLVVANITERKRAVEALRYSEAKFRAIFEDARIGIALIDLDGAVQEINPALRGFLGWEATDFQKVGYPGMVHPSHAVEYWKMFHEVAGGSTRTAVLEKKAFHRDGSPVWLHFDVARIVDEAGAPKSLIAIVRDVTERKKAEAAQARDEALRRDPARAPAITTFAAGAARAARGLTTSFMGLADALLHSPALPAELRGEVASCLQVAERGAELTRQLSTIAGQAPISATNVELNEFLGAALPNIRRRVKAGVDVAFQSTVAKAVVKMDRQQLEQIFFALAANADEAMPAGGKATIHLADAVFDAASRPAELDAAGAYAVVKFVDAGGGIDEAARPRLFEPFFTTKSRSLHAGLGLATVLGAMKQNGGGVAVASCDKGATVTLYFPRSEAVDK